MRQSRFAIVAWMAAVYLLVAQVTRCVLAASLPADAGVGLHDVVPIAALGLLYDLCFVAYASIVPVLFVAACPTVVWRSPITRAAIHVLCFATIYGFGFIVAAEYLFWREFSARFNFISVDYLVYRREVTNNIAESYPVVAIFSGIAVVTIVLYALLARRFDVALRNDGPARSRWRVAALWLALPVAAYFGVGQELRDRIGDNYARELASDGPYQFVAAFRNNELDYVQFYQSVDSDHAVAVLKEDLGAAPDDYVEPHSRSILRRVHAAGAEHRYNVILVMVESLSAEYLARFTPGSTLTPNLDALIGESLFFNRMYATGTRTVRGLEAVTLSIPPTPGYSIVKRIGRESGLWSFGNVLRARGYDTQFIYGGRGYFDNMAAFFSGNGYGVIDQSSVPDADIGFSNAWGMADEDLYKQTLAAADRANSAGKPFFFHLMTTSNHRPYTYPDGRIDIPSGSGRDGAVKYTDYAIAAFLRDARSHAWFDDTLFVIVADHCAGSAGKEDLPLDKYHIPLWIYGPKLVAPREVDTLMSQIDIAPTILALLNVDYRSMAFGVDALSPQHPSRALIGNYQYLGYYDGRDLTILQPRHRIERYRYDDANSRKVPVDANDAGAEKARAYYQVAAETFKDGLNEWSRTGGGTP
ncbi:MAG TPA: LTA synthase family protein [Pseudomonadales bacterium]|nr:LTA synthase family protein [Pseudomonadales bacterium]